MAVFTLCKGRGVSFTGNWAQHSSKTHPIWHYTRHKAPGEPFLCIWKAHYHEESVLHTWQGVSKNETPVGPGTSLFKMPYLSFFLFSHDIQRVLWKKYSDAALCKVTASEWALLVSFFLFKAKEFQQNIPYFFWDRSKTEN